MGPSLKNFWLAIVAAATAATDVATMAALLVRAYEDEDLRGPCGGHRRLLLSAALVFLLNMFPSDSRQSQGEGECDNLGPLQFIWGYASWKRHFKSNSSPTNGLTLLSTLSKIHSRGRSAHSLYMAPNLSCRHHHFPDKPMRFPRLPPLTANCFSLGVMCKRLGRLGSICDLNTGISQQDSCEPEETFLAYVSDMPLRSPTILIPFWFGAGKQISWDRMGSVMALMIHFTVSAQPPRHVRSFNVRH